MAAVSFTRDIPTRSLLAGNVGHLTAFEHIQSITVGSLGASSVTFSEIPQDYRHLQIRLVALTNRGTYGIDGLRLQLNGDTGSNYARHRLYGNGATPTSDASTSQSNILIENIGTTVSSYPGAAVIDILDYSNTVKNTTVRSLCGGDLNGSIAGFPGTIQFASGLWMNTAAVNSFRMSPDIGTLFTQYSTFSLYGIR